MTESELPCTDPIDLLVALERAAGFPIKPEHLEGMVVIAQPPDDTHSRSVLEVLVQLHMGGAELAGRGDGFVSDRRYEGVRDLLIPDFYVLRRKPTEQDEREWEAHRGWYRIDLLALVGEITSCTHEVDTGPKYRSYAQAGVPVYVIVHRQERKVYVFSDPVPGERRYDTAMETTLGHKIQLPAPYPVLDTSVCLD